MARLFRLILFYLVLFVGNALSETKRLNIVLIVSDDIGWKDVGYHGSVVKTLHIDQLAKEGMQLDRFYAFPICSPTRVALMTGRSPIRMGILSPLGGSQGVPLKENFLPASFQKAGYQTVMVGKWHLGSSGEEYSPQKRGFDHFYGFRGGVIDYYTHRRLGRSSLDWQRNGKVFEEEGYATDLFAKEAVKMITDRDKKKPLFLYLAFNAPHGPFQAPEEIIEKYRKAGLGNDAARAACIDSMDQAIGEVLGALKKEEMVDDTLVMFFCDNGAGSRDRAGRGGGRGRGRARLSAEKRGMGNEPLRGGKGSVWEGGVRVPAVIRWPKEIPAGSKSSQVIAAQDLLPTLTGAAGIPHGNDQELDGVNLWPALSNSKVISRAPLVIASTSGIAVIKDEWKLVKNRGEEGLYNLTKDPEEKTDLSEKEKDLVATLEKVREPFDKMVEERPDSRPRGRRGRGGRRGEGGRRGGRLRRFE